MQVVGGIWILDHWLLMGGPNLHGRIVHFSIRHLSFIDSMIVLLHQLTLLKPVVVRRLCDVFTIAIGRLEIIDSVN